MHKISAVALPDHLEPDALRGRVAVVIDVLRATTTIARAFEQGAACVVPVASIDAARMIAHEREGALLCGERGGIKPEGFVLGNSPGEYTPEAVGGRDLVLTTTNGTRALHMCDGAAEIITGSITTLHAVCGYLSACEMNVVLVCSGTDQRVSLEDCICAGAIVGALDQTHAADDSARLMQLAAKGRVASSYHACRLVDLGFGADVEYASQRSVCEVVAMFDPAVGEIRPVDQKQSNHG